MAQVQRVAVMTKEYPPYVYGGAGVHVDYLCRELARLIAVEVRCFGDQDVQDGRLSVKGYGAWDEMARDTDPRFVGALDACARDLAMAKDWLDADLVHCHTWYTSLAGRIAAELWDIPCVVTIHSLEPLRPWKVEQLGNAYYLSTWMERTAIEQADAVIAVSEGTRQDVLRLFDVPPERVHVIYNGIDLQQYHNTPETEALVRYGIDPNRPYVLFVGRMTRQKGIIHLIDAIPALDPALQVVLCAGASDTPELGREIVERIKAVQAEREGVIWIEKMMPRPDVIQLYAHATVFCCPSVYEPFGIINLEAMACETAVVASAVGGIPEVVVRGETGILVDPHLIDGTFDPVDPAAFARDLAAAINEVARDEALRATLGRNGRRRVEEHFSWEAIARQTLALYQAVLEDRSGLGARTERQSGTPRASAPS